MSQTAHQFFVDSLPFSTYRNLLTDQALAILEEIASDEEWPGSSDAQTLSLLTTLVHTCQMPKVLQIGTWIGFSTVALAGALSHLPKERKPTLTTIDPAIPQLEKAKSYVCRAGLSEYVKFITGSSLDTAVQEEIKNLGPYDLVFIDSQHDYSVAASELKTCWPCVKEGGILAIHDASEFAAQYDTKNEGGVIRAVSEWIEVNRITQYLLFDLPYWNTVGLVVVSKSVPAVLHHYKRH